MILTSGTTGKPKGAPRAAPGLLAGAEVVLALLGALPLRARRVTVLAAPMFHTWGFAHLLMGLALQSTFVVRRRFEPEIAVALLDEHRASALVAVPVMLQRIDGAARGAAPEPSRARAAGGRAVRLRDPAVGGRAVHERVRRRRLQPLRLHRAVLRDGRRTEDLRQAPGTAAAR